MISWTVLDYNQIVWIRIALFSIFLGRTTRMCCDEPLKSRREGVLQWQIKVRLLNVLIMLVIFFGLFAFLRLRIRRCCGDNLLSEFVLVTSILFFLRVWLFIFLPFVVFFALLVFFAFLDGGGCVAVTDTSWLLIIFHGKIISGELCRLFGLSFLYLLVFFALF